MAIHRPLASVFAVATLLAAAPAATAATIIQPASFTIAGALANVAFTEFDPSLGTLDSVRIDIDGVLNFQVLAGPGATVAPFINFNILRLTPGGFSMSGAQFVFVPQTNGDPIASQPLTFATSFSLDLVFDSFTDLVGFDVPGVSAAPAFLIPPGPVFAQRADFIEGIVALGIIELLQFLPANFTPLGGPNGGGSFIVTYEYTPEPAPVGEPATLALVGLGLLGLGALRRRR